MFPKKTVLASSSEWSKNIYTNTKTNWKGTVYYRMKKTDLTHKNNKLKSELENFYLYMYTFQENKVTKLTFIVFSV